MRILIVDDNSANAEMLMTILKSKNYDVASASNGREAFEKLNSKKYDLIISDILMPVMDGFQLCRECKKDDRLKDICFIFYSTMYVDDRDEEFAMTLGARKFIRKPQEPEDFLNQIEEVIEKPKTRKITPEVSSEQDERGVLKLYNERLITKLKKRNLELEKEIVSHENIVSQLIDNGERFRSFIEQSSEGILLADDKGIIIECNKALESITGLKIKQIIGNAFWELQLKLMPPDSNTRHRIESFKDIFPEVILTGKSDYFYKPLSIIIRTFKGEYKTILQSVFPIKTNRGYYIGALINDVTERTKTEEALNREQHLLNSLIETIPDCIYFKNEKSRFIKINNTMAKRFGLNDSKEALGKTDFDFFDEEHARPAFEDEQRIIKTGEPVISLEEKEVWPDGHITWVSTTKLPLRDENGRIIGIMGISRDITDIKKAEEALQESEEKYRSIVETTAEWIWEIDINGKHTFSNKGVTAILGYHPEELIGKNSFLWMHDEDRSEVEKKLPQFIADKCGWRGWILRWRHKNGSYRFLESNAEPVIDLTGMIRGYRGSDRDITNRIDAEEALVESEMKYRTLVMNSPDGIFIMDLSGNFLSVNKSMCDNLKYTEKELLSVKLWDIVPTKYKSLHKNRLAVIMKGKTNNAAEYKVIDKDGNEHDIEVLSVPYYKGKEVIGFQGIARDITEKKQAAEKLARERILLRTLIDNLPDNIYVKDIKGRKVLTNKADLALIGKPEEEVIGKDDSEYFPAEIAESFMDDDRLVLEKGQAVLNREEKVINYQNKSLWLLTSKLPLYDHEGQITGLIGIGHNITERKKAEELLKEREQKLKEKNEEYLRLNQEYQIINQELTDTLDRMQKMNEQLRIAKEKAEEGDRLKTTFLANMSHEIRTPMNGILGFTQILQQTGITDSQRVHYLDIINKSCERLLSVVNDIIDISKIESGIIELQYSDVNINEMLDELYNFHNESCKNKDIKLKVSKQLSVDKIHCSTDAVKLEQILSILIDNAIKFTNSGTITISSYFKGSMLEFAIKDTGIGIEEKDIEIIFDRFRQADERSTRVYGGTGLGLAIAKAYVNELGGKIWLKSAKSKGTTVYFNIPYIPAGVLQKSKKEGQEKKEYDWSGKKILIAEDEKSNYEYIAEIIEHTKATFYQARNGKEAVSIFEANNPDLILMDIKMPEMDGILATKEIRKKNKKVPIIALTAYVLDIDKTETLKAGFDDHITKPVYVDTILSVLDKYLK
jgi:PAS domain S-box-containing protein